MNPSLPVNSYKSFVRENVPNNARAADLLRLLKDIEANRNIRSNYDAFGFVNDLECLENQYYQLRNDINFVPYLKALSNRIVDYTKTHKESKHQKVLRFVYTATLSKLHSVKNRTAYASIIDLNEYMDLVQNHINKLREADSKAMIAEYQSAYQSFLYSRIETGAKFIEKQILPDIKNVFVELDEYIVKLVVQTQQRQRQNVMAIRETYEDKEKLRKALILRQIFIPVKLIGAMLGFLNPIIKGLLR